jgi:hypothetical protein
MFSLSFKTHQTDDLELYLAHLVPYEGIAAKCIPLGVFGVELGSCGPAIYTGSPPRSQKQTHFCVVPCCVS